MRFHAVTPNRIHLQIVASGIKYAESVSDSA